MSVAVAITCYNEGAYILQAIQSVLEQTDANEIDKIVVVDDGSAQSTLSVILELPTLDPRIELVFEQRNGLAKNRNIAISRTNSEYVAILDGDDIWAPEKLERQLSLLRSDVSIGLVYSAFAVFEDAEPQKRTGVSVRNLLDSKDPMLDYFLNDAPIIPSTVLFRRKHFDAVGGFDSSVAVFEDTEFYLRLLRLCRFAAIQDTLLYKRVHKAALTARRGKLMKHHAMVAFQFAEEEPRLGRYVGKRLSERARKLGNMEAKGGHMQAAMDFYNLALSLNPFNLAAHTARFLLRTSGRHLTSILGTNWIARTLYSWRT